MSKLHTQKVRINRRRRLYIIGGCIPFVIAGLMYGIAKLSYVSVFAIQDINIRGVQTINAQEVRDDIVHILSIPRVFIFSGNTPITYPKSLIQQHLEQTYGLLIKQVKLSGMFSRTLNVTIEERTPVASWCDDVREHCMLIDYTGLSYATNTASSTLFTFTTASTTPTVGMLLAPTTSLTSVRNFMSQLAAASMLPVSAAWGPEGDIVITTASSGPMVIVAEQQDFDTTYRYFSTTLREPSFAEKLRNSAIQYIDLRFGNKVYYKEKK